jgi:hypothetical protein
MASKSKKSADPWSAARERIYKNLFKRSWLLAPDPVPVRPVTVVPPKRTISRARQRHAQLTAECARADPRLA